MYSDESIMAQTKRMSVIEARIELLRKKEARVIHEKHEFERKQVILYNLLATKFECAKNLTIDRLKVIRMEDLLRIKARHEWKTTYYNNAKRI